VAWQVRSRLRRALLELHAATGMTALVERQITIQQSNVGLLERQLAAGEISAFELTQARLALDAARFSLHDARSRRAEAYVRLAAALGVTTHALDGINLSLERFQDVPRELQAPEVRRRALQSRPDVLGALAEYEATQANLQLEVSRQYPDLHLGPGYQMDQTDNKWTLGLAGLLPLFNRNRGPIAEAEARRVQAAARFVSVQSRALEDIEVAVAGYESARAKLDAADALLTDLRKQQQVTERRWQAGDISRLELGTLHAEIVSSELTRFDALVKAHDAIGQLEDAIQSPTDLPEWLGTSPRSAAR
jgi:outer membrane protein TolC